MKALSIHAGPDVRQSIERNGLKPQDIAFVSATASGLQGLVLGCLDRYLFGDWLAQSTHTMELIGSSFGSLRMAAAACPNPVAKLQQLEDEFIADVLEPGHGSWDSKSVAEEFSSCIRRFYQTDAAAIVENPRYRLHAICSRGRGVLNGQQTLRHGLGYALAFAANAVSRKGLGWFFERAVFSSNRVTTVNGQALLALPSSSLRTDWLHLTEHNLTQVLLASCSIPFALPPVFHIPGAKPGMYWDGGVTDYSHQLRLDTPSEGYVLMLHVSDKPIPSWLDAPWWWRHLPARQRPRLILLSPTPEWIQSLPRGKLPDRSDFRFHGNNKAARMTQWKQCMHASEQLAQEFCDWLGHQDPSAIT